MASNEILDTRYRAYNDAGAIVYESDDVDELIQMCYGKPFTIHVMTTRKIVSDWEPMDEHVQNIKIADAVADWTNTRR